MIELSPDLSLILPDLCLLIFKTTGRATDEPELKLNWEQSLHSGLGKLCSGHRERRDGPRMTSARTPWK